MTAFIDRDCGNCIFHDGRCTRWDCKYISREEAEKALEQEPCEVSAETWGEISGAWTVRFAPNEPCEDAISREAAINIASLHCLTIDESVEALKRLPSVTPRRKGHWHYTDLPPSDPYKRYVVIYDPWDNNNNRHSGRPRFEIADYYTGDTYNDMPWHFDICYSAKTRDILAWHDVGEIADILSADMRGDKE